MEKGGASVGVEKGERERGHGVEKEKGGKCKVGNEITL